MSDEGILHGIENDLERREAYRDDWDDEERVTCAECGDRATGRIVETRRYPYEELEAPKGWAWVRENGCVSAYCPACKP